MIYVQEKQLWLSNSCHSQWSLWVLQILCSEVWTKSEVPEYSQPPPGASPQLFLFEWWLLLLFKISLPHLPHLSNLFSPNTLGCWASREREQLEQSWLSFPFWSYQLQLMNPFFIADHCCSVLPILLFVQFHCKVKMIYLFKVRDTLYFFRGLRFLLSCFFQNQKPFSWLVCSLISKAVVAVQLKRQWTPALKWMSGGRERWECLIWLPSQNWHGTNMLFSVKQNVEPLGKYSYLFWVKG